MDFFFIQQKFYEKYLKLTLAIPFCQPKKKTIKRGRIEWMTNRLMDTDGFIEYCLNLAKINNVFMISNV